MGGISFPPFMAGLVPPPRTPGGDLVVKVIHVQVVLDRAEPRKAIGVEVGPKGAVAGHKDIHPQVELLPTCQGWEGCMRRGV